MNRRMPWILTRCAMFCLCAAVLVGVYQVRSYACESEIEWETSPLVDIEIVYQECVEGTVGLPDRTIRQRLRFRIDDGQPFEAYEIWIHGRNVATLVTDSDGRAEWEFLRQGIRIGPDGRPRSARRIDDGDVCGVEVDGNRFEAVFVRI